MYGFSKRLEETVKRMRSMADELSDRRERNSQLTMEFLPESVAEIIRTEDTVAASEF
jgi:hypothetical protein